jgi:predicted nucleotidyltransferase
MEYGRRVRARREALDLTQRDLAERSGVKQPLISAVESGKREPSAATREALDRVLAVRPSEVLRFLRQEALAVIERHRGFAPLVFGSVARGTDSPQSDVDLLVTFAENAGITDLLAMEDELAELLTVPVDIVSAGSSGRVIERALAEGVPL